MVGNSSFWEAKWSLRALLWSEVHCIGTHSSHHIMVDADDGTLWVYPKKAGAVVMDTGM